MKKETELRIWKTNTLTLIFCGAIIIVLAYIFLQNKIIDSAGMQGMSSIALGLMSLGLGSFAIVKTLFSDKRIADKEKKEIHRKLSNFSITNTHNIKLIQNLIDHKDNWFPQELLDKKLSQPKPQKYKLTPTEVKLIKGLWIPKEIFFFEYAVHLLDISQHLDDIFVEKIMKYVNLGRELNQHKEICQHWALSRGVPNPDVTKNYYDALDKAKEIADEMKDLINQQIQIIKNKTINDWVSH